MGNSKKQDIGEKMIIDRIENADLYLSLNPGFKDAFAFIKKHMEIPFQEGCYELSDSVYAMVKSYETEKASNLRYETHKDYIDIQYVVKGSERVDWTMNDQLKPQTEYDSENDVIFYHDGEGTKIDFTKGRFIVFYPSDAHKPSCMKACKSQMEKIVIKIRVD